MLRRFQGATVWKHLARRRAEQLMPGSRLMRFRDLHLMVRPRPASDVIQFYSANPNIGNYLPVAGMRQMAGIDPDAWWIHVPIDWDFVNRHYRAAIIGGAGLMAPGFDQFWREAADRCRIPTIMWGLGVCLPDDHPHGSDRDAVRSVAARSDLVNVRDDLTADYYQLEGADISACPTVAYLEGLPVVGERVVVAAHDGLATDEEHRAIVVALRGAGHEVVTTTNVQTVRAGVDDIVRGVYCTSRVVVTTRLHGAIIAYGLGVPYIAVARDEKLRAFHRRYGGGVLVELLSEVTDALERVPSEVVPEVVPVRAFGRQASDWLAGV